MGRLKEINVKAQFAFSPNSTFIATGTAAGSLSDDLSDEAKIEIYDTQLDNNEAESFSLKAAGAVVVDDRCTSIAWGGITTDRKHGLVAAAMESGAVDLWDPNAILEGANRDTALLLHAEAHTGSIRCIDFSSVQTNLLASAGTKGEFFVWDTSKPSASPTAYKSTRLDEIISIAWNKKVGHIIALGGKSGALSVWDLRKKSELLHIPTRYGISAVAWHPTEPTILCTASMDDHNPVIQVWDLRNANAPKASLSGHEKGVLSLAWCSHDAELLLSSGSDNRTLIWNPIKSLMVADLPASSQWVHKVAWCAKQPQIIANATLDGKISIYSLQDTIAPAVPVVIDDSPAGDDFFDSIPKNFQAQTASFTLKQTPKWLKRPVGGRFAFGSHLVQFNSKSTQVELVKHHFSTTATTIAKEIQETLDNQTLPELCQASRGNAQEAEKQDWHIIETLASEHARGALLKYLGFDKEEPETEMPNESKHDATAGTIAPRSDFDDLSHGEDVNEASVFGAETAEDDFLGIINSEASAESTANEETKDDTSTASSKPFSIYAENATTGDNLVTKSILTGQFDRAIDVCLSEDRLSDAFMLALCGGLESQKKVQKAYFEKTSIPYGRLLSSIIAGNLHDVVTNADLKNWKETLAILCNYAKPEDFPLLCELLGQRLEKEDQDPVDATLCYLAGSKLEHLVRLWSTAQQKEEQAMLAKDSAASPSEVHTANLGKLIKKIAIFRKAVTFSDPQSKDGEKHTLTMLYNKYLEFAQLLSDEGDSRLALTYVAMVPSDFDGASTMKERLVSPTKTVQAAHSQKPSVSRPTGMRNVYSQAQLSQEPVQPASPARATNMYATPATSQATSGGMTINGVAPKQAPMQNPYAPPASQLQPKQPTSPYGQPVSAYQPAYGVGSTKPVQQPQQSQYNSFAPPPRVHSSGPPILPAAQRKDITPWNDAPDIPLPTQRRATPAVNRSAITSPFQAATGPTLQGFGPSPSQALAPPPKTRSPAPPKPLAVNTVQNGHDQQRRPSNPYAPNPAAEAGAANAAAPINSPYAPSTGSIPQSQPSARYGVSTNQQQQQPPSSQALPRPPPASQQAGPPSASQPALFAPPPKHTNGPTRGAAPRAGASPKVGAPPVARGVNLSPEPSRQSSPVQEKFELPAARYPPGDRTHIPESDRPIEGELLNLLGRLQTVSPEKYRRPLEDTGRRLNVLFDQLNNTQLTDGTREQLRMLSSCLRTAEWARGYAIHMELTSDKMHECRDWIVGIKTLIVLGKKSVEEAWS